MVKRGFDLIVSISSLIILSPLLLLIVIIIKLKMPGPIFYRAKRSGRYGKPFFVYKFRSMMVSADQHGPAITTADDRRITAFGRVLRRTKLDELPQLLNVLRGQMSIVGPRPEDPRYVALYSAEQWAVLEIRPGITSLASVRYRNEAAVLVGAEWENKYITHVMPEKLAIDLDYVRRANVLYDVAIILRTVIALFH